MCQLSVVPQETSDSRTLGRKVSIMFFIYLNLFKGMCVCVCVCMYVYMCVCVISGIFFLLSLLRMSLLLVLRVAKRPGYSDCSLSKIFIIQRVYLSLLSLSSSSHQDQRPYSKVKFV